SSFCFRTESAAASCALAALPAPRERTRHDITAMRRRLIMMLPQHLRSVPRRRARTNTTSLREAVIGTQAFMKRSGRVLGLLPRPAREAEAAGAHRIDAGVGGWTRLATSPKCRLGCESLEWLPVQSAVTDLLAGNESHHCRAMALSQSDAHAQRPRAA